MMVSKKLRIVSLCPSATETAYTLGLGPNVVGVSHQCDYPEDVKHLPKLTRSLIEDEGDSASIDKKVAANRERWGTIYDVDEDLLAELKPDIILTQNVCRVCAFPADAALDAARRKLGSCFGIAFTANRVQDVLNSIMALAQAADIPQRGKDLAQDISQTLDSMREITSKLEAKKSFTMEWIEPVKNAGHWIPELMEAAGGKEELANWDGGTHVSWEDVVNFAPEVLLISPCGFDFERTLMELHKARKRPRWEEIPAVRNARVFLGNGKIITRYTPRIRVVVRAMAHMLHPEHFLSRPDPQIIRPLFC